MQIRILCVAALVAALVGIGSAARAAAADEKRLLVLEAPGNLLTPATRERLRSAIAEVATSQGLAIASDKDLPAKLLVCDLPGCLPSIAAASGAIYVLRVGARFVNESFKLALELWNSDEGVLLGKDRRDCPICDEQDLWGSAALMARGLLERALHVTTPSVGARPTAHPATPSDGLTQAPATRFTSVARYSGLALGLVGVAGLTTGIYYWSVDGERVGAHSDYVRDTRKLGMPMTIAGGAALLAGAGLFAWSFWAGAPTVALAPSGLSLGGRF